MRKFKHKTTRDVVKTYSDDYYISTETACIPKRFIENSNDWEEIKEKDYEILSFKHIISGESITPQNCNKTIAGYLNHKSFKINSVRRLSDGEVFTLGDTIANMCNSEQKIKELYINKNDGKMCVYTSTTCRFTIHSIKKVSHPILTTEDGVEIYGGEALHIVSKCFSLGIGLNFTKEDYKDSSYLLFAKKENAEKYIQLNSPKYSIKDIIPIVNNWSMCEIDEGHILNFLSKNENNNL